MGRITDLFTRKPDGVHDGAQDGHHDGARNGTVDEHPDGARDEHEDGHTDGGSDGHSDGSPDGQPYGFVEYYAVGDRILARPPGLRPPLTAGEHALALLIHLQHINDEFQGRWIATGILEKHLYPEFIKYNGWQAYPWKTVAHELGKLTKKRQKDCRSGGDRGSPSPREYLIPRLRPERAPKAPHEPARQASAKVA